MIVALIQTIRAERASVKAANLDARLKLAQSAQVSTSQELALTRKELAERSARHRAEVQQLEGRIRVYQSLLAQKPENAADLLRDRGKRVLPDQGGNGPGATGAMPGGAPSKSPKLGNS